MGCMACPRLCGAKRDNNIAGYCGMTDSIRIARAALHMWEEPCISAPASGTVFFSGCNLRCVFCQNHDISSEGFGAEITKERLCEIFFELREKGASNINLVTPSHYVPQILPALISAKEKGLDLPFVYNSGGYDSVETLRMLNGLIDIYLPDFKYLGGERALRYSGAKDYPEVAKAAINEMVKQVGAPVFTKDGIMQKGVIVRHLLLPGGIKDSKRVLRYLHETYGDMVYISIMSQYTPLPEVLDRAIRTEAGTVLRGRDAYPELYEMVCREEYDRLVDFAVKIGIENAFIQEGEAAKESFIPPFTLEGV